MEEICKFYRGESEQYEIPCQPSISRCANEENILKVEYKYYNSIFKYIEKIEFSNQCIEEIDGIMDLKYLSIFQHYGFDTRLLDVTKNMAVALYFACNKDFNENGYIYIFDDKKYRYLKDNKGKTITRKMECIVRYNEDGSKNIREIFDENSRKFTIEENAIVDCDKIFNHLKNVRYKAQDGSFILVGNVLDKNNCLTGGLSRIEIFNDEIKSIDKNKKLLYLYKLCCEKEKIDEFGIDNNKCICYVEMFPDDEFTFKIISYWEKISLNNNSNELEIILRKLIEYLDDIFIKKHTYPMIKQNTKLTNDILGSREKFYFFCYEFSKYYSENEEKFTKISFCDYCLKDLIEELCKG